MDQNIPQQAMQQNQQQPQMSPDVIGQAQQQSQAREGQIQQEGALGQQNQQNSMAAVSQAMAMLNPGANSGNKTFDTASKVGQQLDGSSFAGLCQAYAEKQTYGRTGIFPSATAAWNSYSQNGQAKPGLDGIKKGDLIYFNDPNQPNGHVGIYEGGNVMKSATFQGVKDSNISDWTKYSGQSILGHVSVSK